LSDLWDSRSAGRPPAADPVALEEALADMLRLWVVLALILTCGCAPALIGWSMVSPSEVYRNNPASQNVWGPVENQKGDSR